MRVATIILVLCAGLFLYTFMEYKRQGIEHVLEFPADIRFTSLGAVIAHQDGSLGQPNPPVNMSGQHLAIEGDFQITFIAKQIDSQAILRLYSAPPIIYDQWRFELPSLEIQINLSNNTIAARIWDGSSSYSMDMRMYEVSLHSQTTILLQYVENQITMSADGLVLGSMPDHRIFSSGEIWLGADGDWTLAMLRARPLETGRVEIINPPLLVAPESDPSSLRALADANGRKLKMGAAVALVPMVTNKKYRDLALGQFSMWTLENSMKPQFIHPSPGAYVFEESDQLVEAALKNGIAIHGHVLVYDKSSPEWMTKSAKEDRQEIMLSHIKRVVGHFKGKVAQWDVVNEPFSKKNALYGFGKTGLEPNVWFEAMGEQYIDLAFKAAREVDPKAKLYLNDYALENDGQHWDAFLALVKRLQRRDVPIDGVGFEAHVYTDGDYLKADQLKRHMQILAGMGLLVRISEIDVTGDDPKEQVNQYVTALDVCLKAPNCTSYTTWGITDLYGSTTRSDRYPLVYGTSLLWDTNSNPKPAYSALQNRLRE